MWPRLALPRPAPGPPGHRVRSHALTPGGCHSNTGVQSQNAVSAYFTSKQILPFGFAEQDTAHHVTVSSSYWWPSNKTCWPNAGLMLGNAVNSGPTLNQHWNNETCLLTTGHYGWCHQWSDSRLKTHRLSDFNILIQTSLFSYHSYAM